MQRTRFFTVMGLWVGLLGVISMNAAVTYAQDATTTPVSPVIADTCADVRFLMARDTTPDALLQGGGLLQSDTPVTGQVGAGTDMGDHWIFAVDGASSSTTANLTFSNLPPDLSLEFALFQGMTRITQGNTYQPITAGETYSLPTKTNGVYTLVVQLAHISDLERLTQTATYTLTASFQSGGDTLAAVNAKRVRDSQTNQDLIQGQDYEVKDGKQIFTFRSGSQFKVDATGVKSITQMPDKAGRLDFDGGGTLILDSWVQQVSLLGGNLAVVGQVDKTQREYFIENFGAGASLINPTQTNLRDITDSNGTHIATDWANITGLWVMTDCMGYKLADGRIFTTVIDNQLTQRNFLVYGAPDATVLNCGTFLMRLSALNSVGKTVDESLCLTWTPIETGTEVTLRGGVLSASLLNGRTIKLQSDSIRMLPLQGAFNPDSPDLPLDIQLSDGGQPVAIKLDWINLASFGYADEGAAGRTLSFTFIDQPRSSTSRPGANVQSVDALQDVLHIIYRGDNGSPTGGRELLMLPRSESYLEVVTPAGIPTFNGAPFNGLALPNEAGYQARGLNNLGGECYPVNTLLEQVNCAPNGHINPANGNLWYSVTDLTAYHPLFNLSLTRSYNSYNFAQDGAFGAGWTNDFPLDYTVGFDPTSNSRPLDLANADPVSRIRYRTGLDVTWAARGVVVYTSASGSQHEFVRDDKASGTAGEVYRALTMPGWSLSRSGADAIARVRSNWTLTQNSGLTYIFDRAGRLHSFGYPAQGYEAVIHYPYEDNFNGPGTLGDKPVTITDSTGARQIELFYDPSNHIIRSRLRDLTQSAPNATTCDLTANCFEVNYAYTNRRLTEVTYWGGQKASYAYDELGRLIRHDDPRAPIAPVMGYVYDDTGTIGQGAVTSAYILNSDDAAPKDDSFVWQRLETVLTGTERQVTLTDANGVSRRNVYKLSAGTLTSAGDSYTLAETDNLWASAGSFEAVPTKYEWAEGQLQNIPTRFLQGAATSGRSRVDFGYDSNGQITDVSGAYPGLNVTTNTNAAVQFPVRQIVPQQLNFADGAAWSFGGYNQAGFFSSYSDPNGATYTIERDAQNRPVRVLRNEDKVTWILTYDGASGLLSSVQQINLPKNDNGYTVHYQWDGLGRLISLTDDLSGSYQITYAPLSADASGTFNSTIIVTDPAGAQTVSRFDGRGRLIETRLEASASSTDYLNRTTYEYDPADKLGRVSAQVRWLAGDGDPVASRTSYQYVPQPQLDTVGEAVAIGGTKVIQTDPYGQQTTAVYDALGRIRLMGDPVGLLRRFDYSVTGVQNPLPANQINPNGLKIVEQDYLTGQLTASTDYLFDYGWQLTGVIRTEQNPFVSPSGSWTSEWRLFTQTVNNINPNLKSLIAPVENFPDPGIVWGSTYVNGQATQVTAQRTNPLTGKPDIDPNAQTRFDFLGRPLELTQTVNGAAQTTAVTYCPIANGGSLELRAKAGAPALNCDKAAEAALALIYDAQQRLIGVNDASGSRSIAFTVDSKTGGSTVEVKFAPIAGGAISTWVLAYDAAGQLRMWTDEQGITHTYSYDTLGRLTAVNVDQQPQASFSFTYNLADLLISRVDGTGRGFAYSYDAAGHLILQQDVLTKDSVSYTYDTRGQLISQISPLGSVTTYEYTDPVDPTRLTAVITAAGREQFTWNDDKSSVTYTDPRGNQTVYSFDGLGMLWKVAAPLGRTYQMTYDEAGNLTGWQVQDGANRLIKLAQDFAKNQMTVSADGTDWSWAFDLTPSGQLSGITNPAGQKLGLNYDPLGKLITLSASSKLQWKIQRTAGSSDVTVTGQNGDITYSFDALYRLVKQQQGEASATYEYAASNIAKGLVNARLTDADGTQIYTFWPGDERQPPQVIVRTAGQRLIYTYNTEGLLESISREVCLTGPFADLKGAALDQIDQFSPTACEDGTAPNVWLGGRHFLYDSLGQPIRSIDAEQNSESFTYDAVGNLVSYQNPDGKTYSYEYDILNRLNRLSSPAGIDLLFTYTIDGVASICQARSLDHADYAGCAASGGVIQNYNYDTLGRRIGEAFPLTGGNGQLTSTYEVSGGGAPTNVNGVSLAYSLDGLGLLKRIGDQDVNYSGLNTVSGISGDSGFEVGYDPQGRLQNIKAQGSSLSVIYASDGSGYTITDDKTGATLIFKAGGNGLIDTIDYKPGNPDEKTPVLQVQYIGQESNGLTSFSLLWGDNYVTDFRANRQGENIYVNHQTQDFNLGLTLDTVHSASGLLQRQVITGGTDSAGYFSSKVSGGYITVLGYDQNDRLLTMRLSESEGNRLIYQATYVYSDYGQLAQETRQYEGGTQAIIKYHYAPNARNLLVSTEVSISNPQPVQQSVTGIVVLVLLSSGGMVGLRRFGSRRMLSTALTATLVLGLIGFTPLTHTLAQDAPAPVSQVHFTYEYDEHGNLKTITPDGGKACVTYDYDTSNHLTTVTNADKTSTIYRYDAYGRLVGAGKTTLIYVGNAQSPLMVVENGQPRLTVRTADGDSLLQASGDSVTPLISTGDGQVLGQRTYGTAETTSDVHPAWLFDPFGRYLTLASPTAVTDPCTILAEKADASMPNFLPAFDGMLWDKQSNLYFSQGRAYSPALARYLQRDSAGPDAQGSVYDFRANPSKVPIRKSNLPYWDGLKILTDAVAIETQINQLQAVTVIEQFAPSPLGALQDAFANRLRQPHHAQQRELDNLLNLPTWLAHNYNLPTPRFDAATGALRLSEDNAPGQGGWRDNPALDFQSGIWGSIPAPSKPLAPQQQLAKLLARTQLVPQPYTTYLNQAWQAPLVSLNLSWHSVTPTISTNQTPAAVLGHLPRALQQFDQAVAVLRLGQTLDELITMRGVDWATRLLTESLPTKPVLPPANADAWEQQWFTDAMTASSTIPLPALPDLKSYSLDLSLKAR